MVVVPAAGVSRLAQRAISGALPISENVITVAVVTGDDSPAAGRDDELQERWARRNPGPPLAVLHTEYASAAGPVLASLDRLREQRAEQIVVLIPVATPDQLRYRFLHDHLDLMLAAALRSRADIVTARTPVLLHPHDRQHGGSTKALP